MGSGAQWSSVELSRALLIVRCEQVLPLLLTTLRAEVSQQPVLLLDSV